MFNNSHFVFPPALRQALELRQPRIFRGIAPALPFDEERLAQLIADHATTHCDEIRGGISRPLEDAHEHGLLEQLTQRKSSLRMRRVHVIDDGVKEIAFAAHAFFDEEINVNAYWSPPAIDMGLAPHADGYDIIVLQAAGAKRWTLVEDNGSSTTFTLEPGDGLFLPKTLRHHADTSHARSSLHLTFGIYAKTHQSIAEWISSEMATLALPDTPPTSAAAIASVKAAINQLLAPDTAAERFVAYRRGIEYERMLMSPSEHARSDARRYR